MIRIHSQRMLPPYSGQVQIATSERARAVTLDGENWEIQFGQAGTDGNRPDGQTHYRRAAYLKQSELVEIAQQSSLNGNDIDERILELALFLTEAKLPFPAADRFEYWLLDASDDSPLALIFSCTEAAEMARYPSRPEWTALPAAVMPVDATEAEKQRRDSPVNYQLERLVAARAGTRPRAAWFERQAGESVTFPAFMVREDWQEEVHHTLCQRYLQRQSTRLLMLHDLPEEHRGRMEIAARDHVFEVERFWPLYPDVVDSELMNAIRIEARLRRSTQNQHPLMNRRDGVLYI